MLTFQKEEAFEQLKNISKKIKIFSVDPQKIQFLSYTGKKSNCWRFWAFTPEDATYNIVSIVSGEKWHNRELELFIPDIDMKKCYPAETLDYLRENGLMFIYHDNGKKYYIVPTKEFLGTFTKCLYGNGKVFRNVKSFTRDLFLADALTIAHEDNDINLHFIAKGSKNSYRVFACVTNKYRPVDQTISIEVYSEIEKQENVKFVSCKIKDTITQFNFVFPDEKVGDLTPGIQLVFSDTADSSTIVRQIIYGMNNNFVYIDEKSFNHKLNITKDDLLLAIEKLRENKTAIKQIRVLKRRNVANTKEAINLFHKMSVAVKLRSVVGSKKMKEILNMIDTSFNELNVVTYEDIFIKFLSVLSECELTDSTSEKTKTLMNDSLEFLYYYKI